MSKKIITICTSASFYKHAAEVMEELEKLGFQVIVPSTVHRMVASNDYDVTHYKIWYDDPKNYDRKAFLMREHFDEVTKADAILVINDEKHGVTDYIGGNVLMEMSLAFYQKKPIFILGDIPKESTFLEEIIGMMPIALKGNLQKIATHI